MLSGRNPRKSAVDWRVECATICESMVRVHEGTLLFDSSHQLINQTRPKAPLSLHC